MMNCGQESGDQENLAATSLATRWLAAILQDGCAWQESFEGGEEEPVVEGEGTERLIDNQVKGEDQHKALLVLKPLIKRREIEEDGQKSCKKTFEHITCTCNSCTGRENVLASCRASSAPCRGTGPPAPSVKKKTCQEKNLHQHDQDMTKEDFSTCNLFSLKTTLA